MTEPNRPSGWRRTFVSVVAAISGGWMVAVGVWALLAPGSFSEWIDFPPYHEHLLHDAGAFQIGIGVSVLAALFWSDALVVALLGFVAAGGIHTVNHWVDLRLGGHNYDAWLIGSSTLLAAVALAMQIRGSKLNTAIQEGQSR